MGFCTCLVFPSLNQPSVNTSDSCKREDQREILGFKKKNTRILCVFPWVRIFLSMSTCVKSIRWHADQRFITESLKENWCFSASVLFPGLQGSKMSKMCEFVSVTLKILYQTVFFYLFSGWLVNGNLLKKLSDIDERQAISCLDLFQSNLRLFSRFP